MERSVLRLLTFPLRYRRRKHSASEECGRKAGQLQMGRKGDSGPYSPDNVECATKEQKQKAQSTALSSLSPEKRAEVFKKAGLLAHRGEKHWNARPVVTPLGTFVTVTAAAKAHGITQPHGSDLAREKRNGWRYLVDSPAPVSADN
jgi:hypothetical protein